MTAELLAWWERLTGIEAWLVAFGLLAQSLFALRFLTQWIVSEREGRSLVPTVFWYFSILGGALMFVYGVLREDPVIMLGQSVGVLIYARNLHLIRREKRTAQAGAEGGDGAGDGDGGAPAVKP